MDTPASERVRQRIAEWVERHGHGSQRTLLRNIERWCRVERKDQWLSDIINKRANIVLDDVDLVAAAMEVPPGEVIRQHDRNYWELTMAESTMLVWFRSLTSDARRHFLGWLQHSRRPTETLPMLSKKPVAEPYAAQAILTQPDQRGGSHGYGSDHSSSALAQSPALSLDEINARIKQHNDALGHLSRLLKLATASAPGGRPPAAATHGPHHRTVTHHAPRRGVKP